jgi:hypothetical protein
MLPGDNLLTRAEEILTCISWEYVFYDPLFMHIEATEDEREELERIAKSIHELQQISENNYTTYQWVIDRVGHYWQNTPMSELIDSLFHQSKTKKMNEENFRYLKDNIKYMGFGESLNESLQANIAEGKPGFSLSLAMDINRKVFQVDLHFRKSENSDMYFFNSYNASLQRSNGDKVDQTFYLSKGKGVTAKEAYNLLEGRSVYKELTTKDGQQYNAWIQLDFANRDKNNNHEIRQFHENYGYDIKAAAAKFSIVELNDPEREKSLLQSLQKGNIQSVSIEKNGAVSKVFMEANPQYKTLTVYDGQMKRMQKEQVAQLQTLASPDGAANKQNQKEALKPDTKKEIKSRVGDTEGSKKKTSNRKGQSV